MAKPTKEKPAKKAASAMRQAMREEDERPGETPQAAAAPVRSGEPEPRPADSDPDHFGSFEMPHAPKKPLTVSDEVAIEIRDMNKWYGDFHVLRNIDLTVLRGERIVICGPSGSGKSTMIRCINRLEDYQQGRVVVDGRAFTTDAAGRGRTPGATSVWSLTAQQPSKRGWMPPHGSGFGRRAATAWSPPLSSPPGAAIPLSLRTSCSPRRAPSTA